VGTTNIPSIKSDEILIRVCCTALNRMDLLQCRGQYPLPEGTSPIIGVEVKSLSRIKIIDYDSLYISLGLRICRSHWR
jgi:hypothetical protein